MWSCSGIEPHMANNVHESACKCTSRRDFLPISCGVKGLAAAIGRQHIGSR